MFKASIHVFDMQTSGLFWKCGNIGTKLQYSIKITLDLSSDKNNFPERDAELRAVQAPNREREFCWLNTLCSIKQEVDLSLKSLTGADFK